MTSLNTPNSHSQRAFQQAIFPHISQLRGSALRMTRSPSDAEDLVQEALVRGWRFWDRFEAGSNARAWMHRILVNTFINGYRRKQRERKILDEIGFRSSQKPYWKSRDEHAVNEGLGDEVVHALQSLPEEFRDAVLLVDLNGHSYIDAAKAMACPVGTVMSRLHRGRRLLKRKLQPYAQNEGYISMAA